MKVGVTVPTGNLCCLHLTPVSWDPQQSHTEARALVTESPPPRGPQTADELQVSRGHGQERWDEAALDSGRIEREAGQVSQELGENLGPLESCECKTDRIAN